MKKRYEAPTALFLEICGMNLMAESPGLNGETPWGNLDWGGTEGGNNPVYAPMWHNSLWDSDDDELF